MSKIMMFVGAMMILAAAVLISPLADLLPVDVFAWLWEIFQTHAPVQTYRVVAAPETHHWEFIVLGLGLAFVAVGFFRRPSSERR